MVGRGAVDGGIYFVMSAHGDGVGSFGGVETGHVGFVEFISIVPRERGRLAVAPNHGGAHVRGSAGTTVESENCPGAKEVK